jgi:RNA polymerase sigma factor (sigma-70 family)
MFFDPNKRQAELSAAELDQVRKGFLGVLLRRRFSPQFIATNYEELLALSYCEYIRYLDKGSEIGNPVGWMINCAWRRTQNVLDAESHRPQMVSIERLAELVDETAPTAERVVEDADRARKLQAAVRELSEEERRVIALIYFEGLSFRQASRALGWSHSKTVRRERSALKAIRATLGAESREQLALEIGLVAFLSIGGGAAAPTAPAPTTSALDWATHGAAGLWARTGELARRLSLGGEAAGNLASSGAGRAAGVCAGAVAAACVLGASGFAGPGVRDRITPHRAGSDARQALESHRLPSPSDGAAAVAAEGTAAPLPRTQEPRARPKRHHRPPDHPSDNDTGLPASAEGGGGQFGADAIGAGTPVGKPAPASASPGASSPAGSDAPGGSPSGSAPGADFGL